MFLGIIAGRRGLGSSGIAVAPNAVMVVKALQTPVDGISLLLS